MVGGEERMVGGNVEGAERDDVILGNEISRKVELAGDHLGESVLARRG